MSRILSKLTLATVGILVVCTWCVMSAQVVEVTPPSELLTIRAGTKLMLDLDTPLNTATARIDDVVWFTARDDIKVANKVAMPRGTPVRGSIVAVRPAVVNGKNQRAEVRIRLEEVPLAEGGSYAISAEVLKIEGEKSSGGVNGQGTLNSATQGAMLGGLITRSAKGAGIGAAAGVAVSVLGGVLQSKGPTADVDLPSGSIFEAKLERALNIADAKRLAKAVPNAPAPKVPDAPDVAVGDANAPIAVSAGTVTTTGTVTSGTATPADSSSNEVPALDPLPTGEAAAGAATEKAENRAETTADIAKITPTSLSIDVNLVQVDAVVRDRAGKPMGNLRKEDFRVLEDGIERQIQFFSRDQLPLAVALVVDRSGSVAPLMNDVQNAAYQALKLLKNGDEVCLFSFSGSVELLEELTSDRQRVANRIGRIQAGGGTAIVDGIAEALRYLEASAPDRRRAIILISDNVEGNSATPVNRAVEFALESEAVVYSVKVGNGAAGIFGIPNIPGLPAPRLPLPGRGSDSVVKTITKETGGEIFDASGGASIAAALTTAVDRLKLRYTLSYAGSTAKADSKAGYHRIQVQLVSRFGKPDTDYTIHHRSGYYDASPKATR